MVLKLDVKPKCVVCGTRTVKWSTYTTKSGEVHYYYEPECTICYNNRKGNPQHAGYKTPSNEWCNKLKYKALQNGINIHKCQKCGWEGYCHMHHSDEDTRNDNMANLIVLCPNCHMDEHHGKPKPIGKEFR